MRACRLENRDGVEADPGDPVERRRATGEIIRSKVRYQCGHEITAESPGVLDNQLQLLLVAACERLAHRGIDLLRVLHLRDLTLSRHRKKLVADSGHRRILGASHPDDLSSRGLLDERHHLVTGWIHPEGPFEGRPGTGVVALTVEGQPAIEKRSHVSARRLGGNVSRAEEAKE